MLCALLRILPTYLCSKALPWWTSCGRNRLEALNTAKSAVRDQFLRDATLHAAALAKPPHSLDNIERVNELIAGIAGHEELPLTSEFYHFIYCVIHAKVKSMANGGKSNDRAEVMREVRQGYSTCVHFF